MIVLPIVILAFMFGFAFTAFHKSPPKNPPPVVTHVAPAKNNSRE